MGVQANKIRQIVNNLISADLRLAKLGYSNEILTSNVGPPIVMADLQDK